MFINAAEAHLSTISTVRRHRQVCFICLWSKGQRSNFKVKQAVVSLSRGLVRLGVYISVRI